MTSSLAQFSPEYFRFRRRLMLAVLTVTCVAILALSWKIHSSFRARENAARMQTQTYVQAIAAHVTDSIQLIDYALLGFVNAIKVLPPEKGNSSATIQRLLASHDPASGDDFKIKFIDVHGMPIPAFENVALEGVSFAGLDFFQVHVGTHPDLGLHVGEPIIAKGSKKRIFTLSRRVVSAQGEFLGVIAAPVDAERFAAMFENARFNKDIVIALSHQGGKMIARVPLFEQSFAADFWNSDLFRQMRDGPAKTFEATSPVDGRPMIYSFRPLENGPLNVFVAISAQSLKQEFREDMLIGGAGILLMVAIMLMSTHVALHSYRRLEITRQALQKSEFLWKFALEGAGDGVWDWNAEMPDTVQFSIRWKQMLGYAEDEMENTSDAWEERIHPDHKVQVMADFYSCLKGKKAVYLSEYRIRCKDGSWKWVLARGMVVSRDAAGRALRMIGTHADITDRKQAEQAQVHKIIEAAPDPMLLVAIDGMIIFANVAAQSTFGYALNELTGKNVDNLVPFRSRGNHAHYRHAFETNRTQHPVNLKRPLTAVSQDGTEIPVEISLSPFQMDGQPVVIASIRNITERKRTAELLQQSFTQLRRLSDHQQNIREEERKRIAQDIHDDLGQNLLVLKMDVATLYAGTGDVDSKVNKRVKAVLSNIDATIKSVKSIMNDLRPATLKLGLYPAVEWQLKQFERISGIACTLAAIAPHDEFGLNEGQTAAVFRILQESLTNVARHAQATEVEISLIEDERGFSMKVTDNGKGLQPSAKGKANSFGLMGIKERIHSLGGELIIASSPGNGTSLSIFIPVKETRIES